MYRGKKATLAVTFAILMLTIVPGLVRFLPIQAVAAKPQPPSSTFTAWAKAYAFQYDYSAAYSVRQLSNGGFIVGGSCESGTAPATCNGYATVIRVDSSGNLQSQSQYSYPGHPESTALNLIRPTLDGGAILAGQPQSGCPETGLTGCATIVKTDSNGNISGCGDVKNSPDTSSSVTVTVSNSDLKANGDGFAYLADVLSTSPGPLRATKEC